jgi:uncharacterized membrane protein SpoIIM required for sporulation
MFLVSLPTLILEGEAYVLAALSGVILGLSWLKPKWIYKNGALNRSEAFKHAFGECARICVLVVILLLVGTIVETTTLTLIS